MPSPISSAILDIWPNSKASIFWTRFAGGSDTGRSEVAAGVAAELGLEIINSEIVVPHIAGSLGLEHSSVQRYVDGKATLFDRWQIDTRRLPQYTLDHILNLALKDNVLIRGWGAAETCLSIGFLKREVPKSYRGSRE
jgi:hypothetical protein